MFIPFHHSHPCCPTQIPIVVAENKMDLFRRAEHTDEQALARKRQQIVALMQQFPCIRQCIKCSAKTLVRVDDVVQKAQQAVWYPLEPVYDLQKACLTVPAQRALRRIFRMFDTDRDGLLSDTELESFQRYTYRVPILDRDLQAWKKVICRHVLSEPHGAVLERGKFTLTGFWAIFDLFVSQNRLDVVWQCLRHYGYDDDLRLHIPELPARASWRLSSGARKFLEEVRDESFDVFEPPALPPWHAERVSKVFEGCFSTPKIQDETPSGSPNASIIAPGPDLSSSGISILSASDSLPSLHVSPTVTATSGASSPTLSSVDDWLNKWHVVAAVSPVVAREELFRLGHTENPPERRSSRRKAKPPKKTSSFCTSSREIRVIVLGHAGCGKTALIQYLTGQEGELSPTQRPETCGTYCTLPRNDEDGRDLLVHLLFTDVPVLAQSQLANMCQQDEGVFDLALLAFDCSQESSWLYVKNLEETFLEAETPRVFVGCKSDLVKDSPVVQASTKHCQAQDLEEPRLTSTTAELEERQAVLEHLARAILHDRGIQRLRSRPHEEQKRREAAQRKRRNMLWLGGIVSVVVAVGWFMSGKTPTNKAKGNWFASLFRTKQS